MNDLATAIANKDMSEMSAADKNTYSIVIMNSQLMRLANKANLYARVASDLLRGPMNPEVHVKSLLKFIISKPKYY